MRTTAFLSTTAAVLLIGTGIAAAQSKSDLPPEPAPAAQQNAPAEKIAPPMNTGERNVPSTTGQAAPQGLEPGKGGNAATKDADRASPQNPSGQGDMNKADAGKPDAKTDASTSAGSPDTKASGTTSGQGAAAGALLSTEQRSKITTILRQKKVEPVNLKISVRIGARVPSTVRFYPVPVEVIEVYPHWRGYDYIVVGNNILILDSDTHAIVAILAV